MSDLSERQRVYERTRDDLLKRQLSNAENFDKAILSVSTAALGFSLAFLKDIVPLAEADNVCTGPGIVVGRIVLRRQGVTGHLIALDCLQSSERVPDGGRISEEPGKKFAPTEDREAKQGPLVTRISNREG